MAGLADAYCSGCGLDRSSDQSLDETTRTPCPDRGVTPLTFRRTMVETTHTSASMSYVMSPGDQSRPWELRWRSIESSLQHLQQLQQGGVDRAAIEAAERELLDFYVLAYHLKDALIKEGAAPKQDVENAINNDPRLALLADLANLDKHHVLDVVRYPPRSGAAPSINQRAAAAEMRPDGG